MIGGSRHQAAEIVARWLTTGDFPDRLMDKVGEDRAFVMELVYGAARWKRALEWMLAALTRRAPPPSLMPHLTIGLYQVLFLDHVQAYAAVSETVQAVKPHFRREQAGFVNAVLRNASRRRAELTALLARQPLAIRASHPDELVMRWTGARGTAFAEAMCEWNNTRADTIVRVNTLAAEPARFRDALAEAGMAATPHPADPELFLTLPRGIAAHSLPGYKAGWFLPIDPASQTAVNLLDVKPGMKVLDACAAPGGKTFLLAEQMKGAGRLDAMDLHEDRIQRLRENMKRLGCLWVTARRGDAARIHTEKDPFYDRILADAPCSNTGVLRRRPDARWRFSEREMKRLCALQLRILSSTASRLAPEGLLAYSTCSIEPEENEEVVSAFLAENRDFQLVETVSSLPPESKTDGGFAALLARDRRIARRPAKNTPPRL